MRYVRFLSGVQPVIRVFVHPRSHAFAAGFPMASAISVQAPARFDVSEMKLIY